MTYEERQKAICKECTAYNTSKCPYVIRSLRCPNLSNQMEGWELGYKDAIDKACEWLNENMEDLTRYYEDDIVMHDVVVSDYTIKEEFIEAFKKAMEE